MLNSIFITMLAGLYSLYKNYITYIFIKETTVSRKEYLIKKCKHLFDLEKQMHTIYFWAERTYTV